MKRKGKALPKLITCFALSLSAHAIGFGLFLQHGAVLRTLPRIDVQYKKSLAANGLLEKHFARHTQPPPTNQAGAPEVSPGAGATHAMAAEATVSGEPLLGTSLGIRVEYPRLSRKLGEEGRVVIEMKKNSAMVATSSGYARLDEAALKSVRVSDENTALAKLFESRNAIKIAFVFKLSEADAPSH